MRMILSMKAFSEKCLLRFLHRRALLITMTLCPPGWSGLDCTRPCEPGRFGVNCSQICICPVNVACDPVNGTCACVTGSCKLTNYVSEFAQQRLLNPLRESQLPLASSAVALLFIVVAMVSMFIAYQNYYRKRLRREDDRRRIITSTSEKDETNPNPEQRSILITSTAGEQLQQQTSFGHQQGTTMQKPKKTFLAKCLHRQDHPHHHARNEPITSKSTTHDCRINVG